MEKLLCPHCGSDNISVAVWVHANDGTIQDMGTIPCECGHCENEFKLTQNISAKKALFTFLCSYQDRHGVAQITAASDEDAIEKLKSELFRTRYKARKGHTPLEDWEQTDCVEIVGPDICGISWHIF